MPGAAAPPPAISLQHFTHPPGVKPRGIHEFPVGRRFDWTFTSNQAQGKLLHPGFGVPLSRPRPASPTPRARRCSSRRSRRLALGRPGPVPPIPAVAAKPAAVPSLAGPITRFRGGQGECWAQRLGDQPEPPRGKDVPALLCGGRRAVRARAVTSVWCWTRKPAAVSGVFASNKAACENRRGREEKRSPIRSAQRSRSRPAVGDCSRSMPARSPRARPMNIKQGSPPPVTVRSLGCYRAFRDLLDATRMVRRSTPPGSHQDNPNCCALDARNVRSTQRAVFGRPAFPPRCETRRHEDPREARPHPAWTQLRRALSRGNRCNHQRAPDSRMATRTLSSSCPGRARPTFLTSGGRRLARGRVCRGVCFRLVLSDRTSKAILSTSSRASIAAIWGRRQAWSSGRGTEVPLIVRRACTPTPSRQPESSAMKRPCRS